MLDARFSHLYFYQSLNRLQRGLSAIAELLVTSTVMLQDVSFRCIYHCYFNFEKQLNLTNNVANNNILFLLFISKFTNSKTHEIQILNRRFQTALIRRHLSWWLNAAEIWT